MNDKIKDIVVTIIFLFTIIALFLINIIKEDTDISVAERRKLATMPELTTKSLFDGTYFKKFDSYVTDQFVERDAFRKIKIDIELSTKGEYNNLYLYDDYIIEEIFPLNSNSINNLTNKSNYIKDTYLNNNSNIYYTIIPDKNYFVNNGNLKLDYNKLQDMMKNNLSNINISERKREIATLKVLGFYPSEVDKYINRETVLLTILGIGIGLLFGSYLSHFIISTCEPDYIMFDRHVYTLSYFYSLFITVIFTIIVTIVTHFNLKKINMVTSLKNVE